MELQLLDITEKGSSPRFCDYSMRARKQRHFVGGDLGLQIIKDCYHQALCLEKKVFKGCFLWLM